MIDAILSAALVVAGYILLAMAFISRGDRTEAMLYLILANTFFFLAAR